MVSADPPGVPGMPESPSQWLRLPLSGLRLQRGRVLGPGGEGFSSDPGIRALGLTCRGEVPTDKARPVLPGLGPWSPEEQGFSPTPHCPSPHSGHCFPGCPPWGPGKLPVVPSAAGSEGAGTLRGWPSQKDAGPGQEGGAEGSCPGLGPPLPLSPVSKDEGGLAPSSTL